MQVRHPLALLAGVLVPIAAAALVWLETARFGVGVTPDSVAYLSTAESLIAGSGLRLFDGSPYADWPPLYPLLVAATASPGFSSVEAARVLEAGAAMAIAALAMLLGSRIGESWRGAAIAAAAVVLVPPFLEVVPMAWSEPLFVVFVLAFFLALDRDRGHPSRISWLAVTVLAAAAITTRYVGILLVPIGFLALARRGGTRAAAFVVGALAPLGLWALRNQLRIGSPFGRRRSGGRAIEESLAQLDAALASSFFPGTELGLWLGVTALLALGGIAAVLGIVGRPARRTVARAAPLAAFAVVYPAFLVAAAARTPIDPIDARLFFPAAVSLAVLAGALAGRTRAGTVLAVAWLVAAFPVAERAVAERVRHGAGGYSTSPWRGTELATRLDALEAEASLPIYTNAPDALWATTGRRGDFTPWRPSPGGSPVPGRRWPTGSFRIVWFDRVQRDYLRPLDELKELFDLREVASFDGGLVLRGRQTERPSPSRNRRLTMPSALSALHHA